ncbi:hypothetical protein RIF29_17985 [Crotalaria pallida]|uniref:Uncharacterized protein n=1 Tax=Crotalaria pallida TaxID=3830 RepID=A0AAN9FI90_CROPI
MVSLLFLSAKLLKISYCVIMGAFSVWIPLDLGLRFRLRASEKLHFYDDSEDDQELQVTSEDCATKAPESNGRNVVLESEYGSPKIVNDGITVAKEECIAILLWNFVELEDVVESIRAKLVMQAAAKTNYLAGDRTTTFVVSLLWVLLPIVSSLRHLKNLLLCGLQVEDCELADVVVVSAMDNNEVGNMIAEPLKKVGKKVVVTLEERKRAMLVFLMHIYDMVVIVRHLNLTFMDMLLSIFLFLW